MQNEKDALETKNKIEESLNRYTMLYIECHGVLNEQYTKLLSEARKDLEKNLNYASVNRLFASDVINYLKFLLNDIVKSEESYVDKKRYVGAIKNLRNFLDNVQINLSPETAKEYLEKIQKYFDDFCVAYYKNGFSTELFDGFSDEATVYARSRTKDACLFYNELKVPVRGLYQLYKKGNLTDVLFRGISEEIKDILNRHLKSFNVSKSIEIDQNDADKIETLKKATRTINTEKQYDWVQDVFSKALEGKS